MKTALLIAALTLLVIAPLAAQPAAAHHGGWNCAGTDDTYVCTARTLQTGYDCVLRGSVLGHDEIATMCWIL